MTTLSIADANQLYADCLVEVDGRLGFVREIMEHDGETKLAIRFLEDARKNTLVVADPDRVLCPSAPYRLGNVLLAGEHTVYMSRTPRRQYQVGWSRNNVNGFHFEHLMRLGVKLTDYLLGRYLPYVDALEYARKHGSCPFDHQFSITSEKNQGGDRERIVYKGSAILRIEDNMPSWEGVSYTHLRPLLEQAMELK